MRLRVAVIALLIAVMAGALIWLGVVGKRQSDRIAALEGELESARTSPPTAASSPAPPPASAPSATGQTAPPRTQPLPVPDPESAALREQLSDFSTRFTALQASVSELESQLEEANSERTRLTSAEADARTRLADLNQALEAAEAERTRTAKRLVDIEAENAQLRRRDASVSQGDTQLTQLTNELQEILRRQQTYLNNIVSRYREAADAIRSATSSDALNTQSPGLGRVEVAISMADEDLRALRDLNGRLGRVQKQMSAAVAKK